MRCPRGEGPGLEHATLCNSTRNHGTTRHGTARLMRDVGGADDQQGTARMASSKEPRTLARRLVYALLAVLVTAGASDAVPVVQASGAIGVPIVVIACAPSTPGPRVLVVQRTLLQTRSNGRTQAASVPAWAGQWGMIAGSPSASGGTVQQNAAALLAAQTGQSFPSGSILRVDIASDPSDFASTQYVIVQMSESALEQLASGASAAIGAGTPPQGVLAAAEAVSFPEALQLFGPVVPPADGWTAYVVENAFGGVMPGPLDTTFPILVTMLTTRTQQTTDAFQEALLLAGSCGG